MLYVAFNEKASSAEDSDERALLHSELWSSLFRGGYLVGKLERSLSGFHVSIENSMFIDEDLEKAK